MDNAPASPAEVTETQILRRPPDTASFAHRLGRGLLLFLLTVQGVGAFALITLGVMLNTFRVSRQAIKPLVRQQIARAGVQQLPMFLFISIVLGLLVIGQSVALQSRIGAVNFLGNIMVVVIVRELGPLLAALLVLARVGTANVVELGTARAMGEVESLEALGIDPVRYLVVPRVIGMALGIFSLTVYLIIGSLVSGYVWAFIQDVPLLPGDYFSQLAAALNYMDFVLLALKTCGFGFIIAIVTCYHGLAQPIRVEEVSRATVRAVAQGTVACIVLDALFIVVYLAI